MNDAWMDSLIAQVARLTEERDAARAENARLRAAIAWMGADELRGILHAWVRKYPWRERSETDLVTDLLPVVRALIATRAEAPAADGDGK